MPASVSQSDNSHSKHSGSFTSSVGGRSFFGRLNKYELKRRFYEKLDDFNNKVLLHKEQGFIVYRARCCYSGGVVVLKGYARDSLTIQTRQRVYCEVQLLQNAQCPFLVKCFDSFEDQGWWWLVLENCAAGDLYRIVEASGPTQEGWLVSQVLLPIIQTLAYLHAEGIIHRDLKPEHVLFNSEKVAKLSGFFLSWDVNRFSYPKDMVGTLDYVAPEVFVLNGPNAKAAAAPHYDFKVDIWGLGIMAYDMLVGSPPFNNEDSNKTVEGILSAEPDYPAFLSDEAVDFIDQALSKDPTQRPSARHLLSHPWIRQYVSWQPPAGFDDPIPPVDFSYYRADDDEDPENNSEDFGDERVPGAWYNPRTWFRKRMDLDDLVSEGGVEEAPAAVKRGNAWKLTESIGNMAAAIMQRGYQVKVNPEPYKESAPAHDMGTAHLQLGKVTPPHLAALDDGDSARVHGMDMNSYFAASEDDTSSASKAPPGSKMQSADGGDRPCDDKDLVMPMVSGRSLFNPRAESSLSARTSEDDRSHPAAAFSPARPATTQGLLQPPTAASYSLVQPSIITKTPSGSQPASTMGFSPTAATAAGGATAVVDTCLPANSRPQTPSGGAATCAAFSAADSMLAVEGSGHGPGAVAVVGSAAQAATAVRIAASSSSIPKVPVPPLLLSSLSQQHQPPITAPAPEIDSSLNLCSDVVHALLPGALDSNRSSRKSTERSRVDSARDVQPNTL